MTVRMAWKLTRALRWLLWLALLSFALFLYFAGPGQSGIGSSHLPLAVELTLFGLGTAAVLVGFLEMMMRERAGISRPGSPDIPLR
jgi:hypothetical protein